MEKYQVQYSRQMMLTSDFEIHRKSGESRSSGQRNCHVFHEIYILLKGDAKFIVEGITYALKSGDILFISNNEVHYPMPEENQSYERIVVWINPYLLRNISSEKTNLEKCFDTSDENRNNILRVSSKLMTLILNLIVNLEKAMLSEDYGNDLLKSAIFMELMVTLNTLYLNNSLSDSSIDISSNRKINEVLSYINSNLNNKISLDDLASRFYISKYHLLRMFKKSTGFTIRRYIQQKRLMYARDLLIQEYSINEICELCGFNDHSGFVRSFHNEFGISPKKYKKQIQENYFDKMSH